MYGCESWTVKKAECQRIDAFELWCWRRLLKVPWTARRSNQSTLREINPEYSLEGLVLKLKLQYFGHLMWRAESLEKTVILGKIQGSRRRGYQRMRWVDSITDTMNMNLGELRDMVRDRDAWHAAVHGVTKSQTQLNDWTTTTYAKGGKSIAERVRSVFIFLPRYFSFCKLAFSLANPSNESRWRLCGTLMRWKGDSLPHSMYYELCVFPS